MNSPCWTTCRSFERRLRDVKLASDSDLTPPSATGDYNAVASVLVTSNTGYVVGSGVRARLSGIAALAQTSFVPIRQFSSANWTTNRNHTNYHSMQAQVTLRPTHGLSFTTTYTWSRDLGIKGDGTDPLDYAADYGVLDGNRTHALTSYGTYNLPLGAFPRQQRPGVKRSRKGGK